MLEQCCFPYGGSSLWRSKGWWRNGWKVNLKLLLELTDGGRLITQRRDRVVCSVTQSVTSLTKSQRDHRAEGYSWYSLLLLCYLNSAVEMRLQVGCVGQSAIICSSSDAHIACILHSAQLFVQCQKQVYIYKLQINHKYTDVDKEQMMAKATEMKACGSWRGDKCRCSGERNSCKEGTSELWTKKSPFTQNYWNKNRNPCRTNGTN